MAIILFFNISLSDVPYNMNKLCDILCISDKLMSRKRHPLKYLVQHVFFKKKNQNAPGESASFHGDAAPAKPKKTVSWSEEKEVATTWSVSEYDRTNDKHWQGLSHSDKTSIRNELNEYKRNEMQVHEKSKHLTRYHL